MTPTGSIDLRLPVMGRALTHFPVLNTFHLTVPAATPAQSCADWTATTESDPEGW